MYPYNHRSVYGNEQEVATEMKTENCMSNVTMQEEMEGRGLKDCLLRDFLMTKRNIS